MQAPTFLTFSLRLDATEPIEVVAARVASALRCPLDRGSFAGVPAMVGELLGVRVGLLLWRGLGGAHVFELHGMPDRTEMRDVEWQEIGVDRAIIHLLRVRGAGAWRQPSSAEKHAAADYDEDDI